MEKDFFDVFPNLKIKDPLQELLDTLREELLHWEE